MTISPPEATLLSVRSIPESMVPFQLISAVLNWVDGQRDEKGDTGQTKSPGLRVGFRDLVWVFGFGLGLGFGWVVFAGGFGFGF